MVVSDIPARYPPMVLDLTGDPQFKGLCLPRSEPGKNADILIGMDNAYLLKPVRTKSKHAQKGPFAIQTVLRWTICRPVESSIKHDAVVSHCVSIDQQIQRLWDIETSDENQYSHSVEDNHVMSLWEDNITFSGGKYYLLILFKDKVPSFPNNRFIAEKRLSYLRPKLESQELTVKYEQNIEKFIAEGHAERVPEPELELNDGSVWYLPHHPVLNDKKPGKVRTVFDCTASPLIISASKARI